MQARRYEAAGNSAGAYTAYFKLASVIIQTIPKHAGFRTITPLARKRYDEYQELLRSEALPRCEQLKPLLKNAVPGRHSAPLRPGAAQIAASNLPGVDWASSQPTHAAASAPPLNFFEANPTVDRQVLNLTMPSHTSAPPVAQDGDPFAASMAFAPPPSASAVAQQPVPSQLQLPSVAIGALLHCGLQAQCKLHRQWHWCMLRIMLFRLAQDCASCLLRGSACRQRLERTTGLASLDEQHGRRAAARRQQGVRAAPRADARADADAGVVVVSAAVSPSLSRGAQPGRTDGGPAEDTGAAAAGAAPRPTVVGALWVSVPMFANVHHLPCCGAACFTVSCPGQLLGTVSACGNLQWRHSSVQQ
jgi:hypothetical protein